MKKQIIKILTENKGYGFSVKQLYNILEESGYKPPREGRTPEFSCASRLYRLWSEGKCKRIKCNGIYIYFK